MKIPTHSRLSASGLAPAIVDAGKWLRYPFAIATCLAAVGLELLLDHVGKSPVSPFLPAFAAIVLSSAWAGAGAGLAATGILVIWAGFDLAHQGIVLPDLFVRCMLFLADGLVLSWGSARMWRSMRESTRSELWHRHLMETAAEGIWVHGKKGVITYANPRMAEILGIAGAELRGRNIEEFFMPEDLSVERIRADNLARENKIQFDRRLRRSDGTEVWVLACCNPIDSETEGGEIKGSLAMMTDITERKRAETALRRSEERFRNLFEGVLEGVYQSTPEGRILAANPMLLKMLGLKYEAELNDVNIANDLYVDPHIRKRLLERLEQEGGFQNIEYELRRRDGQLISVLENARVVRDENGAVLYYEDTLTDITHSKRMEEQLRQAQKVEALGKLAGGVANDFNNVLTLITGFSQLALSELGPTHPARSNTEQVLRAAESALALTRQLLQFSRRHAPSDGSLDLNQALADSETARLPGVRLELCTEELPVYASQAQVELITRGLCENLLRSLPTGAALEIRTALSNRDEEFCRRNNLVQPGNFTVLMVLSASYKRTIGADAAKADFVSDEISFTPMQPGEGAAMGLSAVQATVTQCGGFIGQHAGYGFQVLLPGVPEPGDSVARTRGGQNRGAAGETILLVENEPLIRELSRDMLERQGYRVILASNAKEAEQISGMAGSFDLLITDSTTPTISGAELARRLRADHPGLKVLYISGYSDDESLERDDIGMEGASILQKPFSADSLGRKIRQMLSRG